MNKFDERELLKERWAKSKALFMHQVVGLKPYDYQVDMLNFRGSMYEDGRIYQAVILPRDSGKSEIGTIGEALWEICHNPNLKSQFIAETRDLAADFLGAVQANFEQNDTLRAVYGDHVGAKWSAYRMVSKQRTIIGKEPTIQVLGAGGAVVGRHVDIQWLDDVVSKKNSRTKELRADLKDWYNKLICPILNPGGTQKIRGTRYYHDDLYSFILKTYGKKAIYSIPSVTWDDDGVATSYCPQRYTVGNLLAIKKKDLVTFLTQYQNDTDILVSNIINADCIIQVAENEIPPYREMVGFQGVDPSIKKGNKTDHFAMHTLGVHRDTGLIYLLRQVSLQGYNKPDDPDSMLAMISHEYRFMKDRELDIWGIGVECNNFQALLANVVRNNPQIYGFLPFIEVYNITDKSTRLHSHSHYFNRELVRINSELTDLIEQLLKFPDVEYDDEVDSMMNAFKIMSETGSESLGIPIDIMDYANQDSVVIGL